MAPPSSERLARRSFRLSDLVFVVGKDQVDSPAMNVERRPEQLDRHRRALEMPPRTTAPPWGIPRRARLLVLRLRRLPESEVLRVLLGEIGRASCRERV